MDLPPPCTCDRPGGAHDERCAHVRFVRSSIYEPDLTVPEFLRRQKAVVAAKQSSGVFD